MNDLERVIEERSKRIVEMKKVWNVIRIVLIVAFCVWGVSGGCSTCYDWLYWHSSRGQKEQAAIDRIHHLCWDNQPNFPPTKEGFEQMSQDIQDRSRREINALQALKDNPSLYDH